MGTDFDILTIKLSQDTATTIQHSDLLQSEFQLLPTYPNPFNPVTNITFSLPKGENVEMKIYNLLGEEITTVISDYFEPGIHTIQWYAKDKPSGIYLCKMQAGGYQKTIKLLLLK